MWAIQLVPLLCFYGGLSGPDEELRSDDSRHVQEIVSVLITEPFALHQEEDIKNIYVNFLHGDNEAHKSIDLKSPDKWQSKYDLEGPVNAHIKVDEDNPKSIFCEIRQRRFPLQDRILGTAQFTHQDLELCKETGSVHAIVNDSSGKATTAKLELTMIQKHWKTVFADYAEPSEKLGKLDAFFSLTSKFFFLYTKATANKNASDLKRPSDEPDPDLKTIYELDRLTNFPETDENDPVPFTVILAFKLLKKLRFDDRLTKYTNRADGIYKIRKTLQDVVLKPPEGLWPNPTQDEQMKRVFFSSYGMFFLKKLPGFEAGYVADTTDLCKYEHRKGYEKYGCKTFFDENGQIVKIQEKDNTTYFPGDEDWEWAKIKARTSAFVKAAYIHLTQCHYIWANIPGKAMRMFLPPSHPIRRTLTIHFYKTHYTCYQAKFILFDEKGLVLRGSSLKWKGGLQQVYKDHLNAFQFTRFTDEISAQGVEDCKLHVGANDGVELHKILVDYVSELIDEVYPDRNALDADAYMKKTYDYLAENMNGVPKAYTLENLKMVWGEVLFRVTGYHTSIGAVSAMGLDPSAINLRLQPKDDDDLVGSLEATLATTLIIGLTTVPCPTLSQDWKQVLENPDCASYTNLRSNLKIHEAIVDERNKVRFVNVDFHPRHAALSVSS